jgi:hypothetical protein
LVSTSRPGCLDYLIVYIDANHSTNAASSGQHSSPSFSSSSNTAGLGSPAASALGRGAPGKSSLLKGVGSVVTGMGGTVYERIKSDFGSLAAVGGKRDR